MERWCGKIAVVTGASSGIGEAIVKSLVAKGMKVVGLARRIERVTALEQSLKGCKGTLKGVKCDVSDAKDVASAFKWVEQHLGGVSVMINNAGVLRQSLLEAIKSEDLELLFKTNVVGLSNCAREAVQSMKKHDLEGCIININSVAGHQILPVPMFGTYSATKHAVTVLTESLRSELALSTNKIRVTSLSPGLVTSEMSAGISEKFPPETPILKASDIADCVDFVLAAPITVNISELTVQPTGESIMKMFAQPPPK